MWASSSFLFLRLAITALECGLVQRGWLAFVQVWRSFVQRIRSSLVLAGFTVGITVVLSLVVTVCSSETTSQVRAERLSSQSKAEPANSLNSASKGLQVHLSALQPTAQGSYTFRVSFENVGENDFVLNLGSMLGNGKVQRPDAVHLILTDANGAAHELRFAGSGPGGVAGRIDDYIVPLRAGSSYSIKLDLADFWSPETKEHQVKLTPGKQTLQVKLTGNGARHLNGDTEGLQHLNFWKGQLLSNVVAVE